MKLFVRRFNLGSVSGTTCGGDRSGLINNNEKLMLGLNRLVSLLTCAVFLVGTIVILASHSATAAPVTFSWDPSKSLPPLGAPGSSFTADTINTTNYLHSVNQASGSFIEEFILQVTGFELNGQAVVAPGLNSSYGLYFTINGTGQTVAGMTTFNNLNVSLMADPGKNNGTPSSTLTGVSFSNGTADDFALGSGMLVSASLALDSAGVRHAFFAETFMSASGQAAFFGNVAPLVDFFLTTPPANFIAVPQPDGTTVQMVNGGIGKVEFVPEPASLLLLGGGLAAAVLYGCGKAFVRDRRE